jgi:hypothetical protein
MRCSHFAHFSFHLENEEPAGIPMNSNITIEMFMFLSLPLVEISLINFTMTLNFDLGNI